jgi:hypothetical protein
VNQRPAGELPSAVLEPLIAVLADVGLLTAAAQGALRRRSLSDARLWLQRLERAYARLAPLVERALPPEGLR